MIEHDTIYAHSSGRPPAAIAVIRVSGPLAHRAATLVAGSLPEPRAAALRTLRDRGGVELDRALLLRFDGPASATGEDLIEFHCHGGRAVVAAVLRALGETDGLREARPGEFTRQALENGRIDLTEAEGLADLLEAETESQRRAALATAAGGLKEQVDRWQGELVELSAMAEAAIDYVGDEEETATDERCLFNCAQRLARELRAWLDQPRAERLKEGVRVVLAGPPNAGKSSLLNALAGDERAIVTELAGTTRDVIEVPLALNGMPLLLVDTAGLREAGDGVEQIGIRLAEQQISMADLLLWLGEPADVPAHPSPLIVHAQADRPERRVAPLGSLAVSAVTGAGLEELRSQLLVRAAALLPQEGQVALNQRQAAALEQVVQALNTASPGDVVLTADALRVARQALERLSGSAGIEEVLDALFGRFCLGK
uniref:tRNA uridine-5-carboxymethylaminomethyl(34) synthesis GTPase MnmE n=1 Tax=uncultured Sphingomonas sp. TaxID=158754 RepID=UPI0025D28C61|nr:tRNA uridine-5-carboxymethylaminomethyl(34) synthesis GTPase MnmE [uncultured Sphingomonas sp.]